MQLENNIIQDTMLINSMLQHLSIEPPNIDLPTRANTNTTAACAPHRSEQSHIFKAAGVTIMRRVNNQPYILMACELRNRVKGLNFIGGRIEKDETPMDAAWRECDEESHGLINNTWFSDKHHLEFNMELSKYKLFMYPYDVLDDRNKLVLDNITLEYDKCQSSQSELAYIVWVSVSSLLSKSHPFILPWTSVENTPKFKKVIEYAMLHPFVRKMVFDPALYDYLSYLTNPSEPTNLTNPSEPTESRNANKSKKKRHPNKPKSL